MPHFVHATFCFPATLSLTAASSASQGMRFEITKPLNQNFFLSHSLFMGNMELGTGGRQVWG